MTEAAAPGQLVARQEATPARTSEMLVQIAQPGPGRVALGDIAGALGDRTFGILILALALPNCVLAPPGLGGVTGLLTTVLAFQLACGYSRPRLPSWIEQRTVERSALRKVLLVALPAVRRFERVARPRLLAVVSGRAERIVGAAMLVQALLVALPIPLTNWLPGVALSIMAAGLIERDGLAILIGGLVGLAGLGVAAWITAGFLAASVFFLGSLGG